MRNRDCYDCNVVQITRFVVCLLVLSSTIVTSHNNNNDNHLHNRRQQPWGFPSLMLLPFETVDRILMMTNDDDHWDDGFSFDNNHNNNNNKDPEEEMDPKKDFTVELGSPSSTTSSDTPPIAKGDDDEEETQPDVTAVGVKPKKSNAVGDPDGEGSSDDEDEDEDDELSDWDDILEDLIIENPNDNPDNTIADVTQVQVEVEFADSDENMEDDEEEDDEVDSSSTGKTSTATNSNSGGIGVRLGQRFHRHKKNNSNNQQSHHHHQYNNHQNQLLQVWQNYVFLPPTPSALEYLKRNARRLDGDGKTRLDRRTLYAGLLLEWTGGNSAKTTTTTASTTAATTTTSSWRKYLEKEVSHNLQASLSLATQPAWRRTLGTPNGMRLYQTNAEELETTNAANQNALNNEESNQHPNKNTSTTTLAMQETIAMALAHSLGAGMVILDDTILTSIRQQLIRSGFSEDEVKPARLIQSVLQFARDGAFRNGSSASISKCMRNDMNAGLDDPFDERATSSCQDMEHWEEEWRKQQISSSSTPEEGIEPSSTSTNTKVCYIGKPLPLVVFIRTSSSNSLLLKSKSVVDTLLSVCNASDSINVVVLGKGIDATTTTLPDATASTAQNANFQRQQQQQAMLQQNMPGAAPWFGFTGAPHGEMGQNDPEGSRRFNIFLARTVDANGTPGIVGAVAPPEAGNLFPHMMAMQARLQLQQQQQQQNDDDDDDSPAKAELERWAQLMQNQIQNNPGGMQMPPPQFFNASLSTSGENGSTENMPLPSPEIIQQTLEHAMSELLDRLAQLNEEGVSGSDMSPDLQKAFAQVLRNESLRRGIAQNLARAAPALSDPKCQGVLLSVFVPPPPNQMIQGNKQLPGKSGPSNLGGWFQKTLSSLDKSSSDKDNDSDESNRNARQKKVRTMAAAAALMAAQDAKDKQQKQDKAERNLARLENVCHPIVVKTPSDPVRAKSWIGWIARERGAVIFRQNRRVLNEELEKRNLSLQEHTGTRGAGSALRQMLSVRLISDEMSDVIRCAIELEAAKSQRQQETPEEMHKHEMDLDVDITLSQLLLTEDGVVATEELLGSEKRASQPSLQYLHPSSLEAALSSVCRISSSPAGGLAVASTTVAHRTKEEIASLAQDKHERALLSQVVSPQDIGVTYDMIGGLSDVKELLRQSITYPLKFPHLYSEGIAREAVKGVLLFGPPGTGKTMLAKAVATEGGASFLSVDASSVENKWLGESEKNAKAVFTLARRLAPCVIFIDEVDSLLSSREGSSDDSAHGTLTSVKTTMMSEWDGLNSGTNGLGEAGSDRVIVIGSTNRPFDLDEAVLRRFPRRILVDLPDLETRTEILEVTLAENRLDSSVNLTALAERMEGYTGSDIKEVCREAVVQISHEQARLLDQGFINTREDVTEGSLQRLRPVTMEDFEKALGKLKRSVSEKGRELARVWEWNDEYGEIKRDKRNHLPHLANMYL